MSTRTKALIAISIAAMLWASASVVSKTLFRFAPPFVAATHRFTLATLIMLPFFLRLKKPKEYFLRLLPLGLFNAGNVLFYYSGLFLTTANTSSILGAAVPITVAIASAILIKEYISPKKRIGIFLGFIGALIIVLLPLIEKGGAATGNIYGNLFLVGSLLSWTMYVVYSRSILASGTYTPILSTFINISTVASASFIFALLTHQPLFPSTVFAYPYLLMLVFAAVFITITTFFLFQWGVQHISASTASFKEYLQLVFGIMLNSIFLHEKLTGSFVIGSIFVALGVFIATGEHLSKKLVSLISAKTE